MFLAVPSPLPLQACRAAILALLAILAACNGRPPSDDPRSTMHGIAAVHGPGHIRWVFFSSAGYPPRRPAAGDDWTHDVFVVPWDAATGKLGSARSFIQRPQAQEPVAAAQLPGGRILLTMEDGWNTPNTVTQRYGIYRIDLGPVHPYPAEVEAGGHSGDVAAVADRFVIAYSEGWIAGGGVAQLGSGNGIYARVYGAGGSLQHRIDLAPRQRAWWPRIAGGEDRALVLWQALAADASHARLESAVLDPVSGRSRPPMQLLGRVQYYVYAAAWLPTVRRFLVVATGDDGHGRALLVDLSGQVVAQLSCMPATVREAGIAVAPGTPAGRATAYTPAEDGRMLQLRASESHLALAGVLHDIDGRTVSWGTTGGIGLWQATGVLHWLSLSPAGIVQARYRPGDAAAPDARDRCAQ